MALGCDSVTKENDGYHYTMTLAWQEMGMSPDSDYLTGRFTMVSDDKFLEPGKVYMFDEEGLTPLIWTDTQVLRRAERILQALTKTVLKKQDRL